MAAPADSQITARAGTAEPTSMALPPGEAVGPLSIGRDGTWRVVAPGVLEEHAFLYFNGTELFIQSADPNSPVTVNGATIPGDWTPVYAPCEIAFGGARLWFGPPSQAARSRPPPPPSTPPGPLAPGSPAGGPSRAPADSPSAVGRRPFGPRVHGLETEEESTRLHFIEEMQASRAKAPRDVIGSTLKSPTAPSSFAGQEVGGAPTFGPSPSSVGAPSFGPPPSGAPVMGPGPMFGAPPPSVPMMFPGAPPDAPPALPPPAKSESWIGARWREASGPKKALMLLLVPLIWAVWVIFTDKPPSARAQKPAASASATPSSTPSAGAPSATSSASGAPSADPAPPPPAPAPSGKASASAVSSSKEKTREREAADAVAAGAYDKAARLYEELAKAHPEVPAYVEAARIMKAKVGKR